MIVRFPSAVISAVLGVPASLAGAILMLAASLALGGCGHHHSTAETAGRYDAELQQWVGRTEAELLRSWGVPTHSQLLSQGGQALEYVRQRGDVVDCTTLFTTNVLGVIDTWTWRGDRCRPPELGSGS